MAKTIPLLLQSGSATVVSHERQLHACCVYFIVVCVCAASEN